MITGDRKALEKVIKEIGILEKNKDDKKLHDEFESIYKNFTIESLEELGVRK